MTKELENDENIEKVEKPAKKCVYLKIIALILYFFALAAVIIGVVLTIERAIDAVGGYQNLLPPDIDIDDMPKLNINSMFTGFGFILGGIVIFIVASIFMGIYRKKNAPPKKEEESGDFFDMVTKSITEQLKNVTEKLEGSDSKDKEEETKPKQKIYCAYCGSELSEEDKKCPSCGSSKKFRK